VQRTVTCKVHVPALARHREGSLALGHCFFVHFVCIIIVYRAGKPVASKAEKPAVALPIISP